MGSRGRAPGQGVRGRSPPEAKTLSFWTCNGIRKFSCFLVFGNARNSHVSVLSSKNDVLVTSWHDKVPLYHHQIFSLGAAGNKSKGTGGSCHHCHPLSLAPSMLCLKLGLHFHHLVSIHIIHYFIHITAVMLCCGVNMNVHRFKIGT